MTTSFFARPDPARFARLLVWGLLLTLIAGTVVRRLDGLGGVLRVRSPYRSGLDNTRIPRQLEMAYSLVERGRVYSIHPGRLRAMMVAAEDARTRIPVAGTVQHVDIGPWLGVDPDAQRVVKDAGNGTNYGYSVIIALVWWLTGIPTLATAGLWILVLDAMALWACYIIGSAVSPGSPLVRRLGGLLAAFLFSGHEGHVSSIMMLHWQAFPTYAALGVAAALTLARGKHPLALGLLCGLVIAVTNEIRGITVLLPVIVAAGTLGRFGWRHALVCTVACVGTIYACNRALDARLARDSAAVGVTIPDRDNFWHVMLLGLGDFPNPFGFVHDDIVAADLVTREAPGTGYQVPEYSAVAKKLFFRQVRAHPRWFLGVLATRYSHIVTFQDSAVRADFYWPGLQLRLRTRLVTRVVSILSAVGLVAALRVRRWAAVPAVLMLAYFVGMPVLTTADRAGYYLAANAFMLVFAAAGSACTLLLLLRVAGAVERTVRQRRSAPTGAQQTPQLSGLAARISATVGPFVYVVFALAALRAAWVGLPLIWHAQPWSMHEGYAAAFATPAALARPLYQGLSRVPQGYVELPLFPFVLRSIVAATHAAPFLVGRVLGVLAGVALAAGVGTRVWRMTGHTAATLAAVAATLALPGLHALGGLRPEALVAGACCLWAMTASESAWPPLHATLVTAALWALALLCHVHALPFGLVILVAAALAGRPRVGVGAILVGGGLAAALLWGLAGTEGIRDVRNMWGFGWSVPSAVQWNTLTFGTIDVRVLACAACGLGLAWVQRGEASVRGAAVFSIAVLGVWTSLVLRAPGPVAWAGVPLFLATGGFVYAAFRRADTVLLLAAALFVLVVASHVVLLPVLLGLLGVGLVARALVGRGRTDYLPITLLACVGAGWVYGRTGDHMQPALAAVVIIWGVSGWVQLRRERAGFAVLASLVLLVQGGFWAFGDRPTQSAADRATAERLERVLRTSPGPVLVESWYGFAANAKRPAMVHAESLRWGLARGHVSVEPLRRALEAKEFTRVVYHGGYLGNIPELRRALFDAYTPEESFMFQSAEEPALLTVMRPRETLRPAERPPPAGDVSAPNLPQGRAGG